MCTYDFLNLVGLYGNFRNFDTLAIACFSGAFEDVRVSVMYRMLFVLFRAAMAIAVAYGRPETGCN